MDITDETRLYQRIDELENTVQELQTAFQELLSLFNYLQNNKSNNETD